MSDNVSDVTHVSDVDVTHVSETPPGSPSPHTNQGSNSQIETAGTYLRSGSRTEHFKLNKLILVFGTAGHSVVYQGTASPGLSDASIGKHLFVSFLLFAGPTWAVAARAPPLPFGLGIKVS